MAYEPIIEHAEGILDLIVKSGSVVDKGDLLGYSSGWVRADADTAAYIYAQYIAMEHLVGDGSKTIKACRRCTLSDRDAPFTVNTAQYVSGTVGEITETRPETDGDLIQVVGRALSATVVALEIEQPKEFEMFWSPDIYCTSSNPGLGGVDDGWAGPQMTSTETAYFKGRLPSGIVGDISIARAIYNSNNASAGNLDFDIVGAYDGAAGSPAANNQDLGPGGIDAQDWVQTDADNVVLWVDVSTLFDSGFYKPARSFCILHDPNGLSGEAQIIGLYIRGFKV